MILDKGICSIYSTANVGKAGDRPETGLVLKYQSWYAELDFSTAPITVGGQEGIDVANRIRIIQNRTITNHDIVILPGDPSRYNVTRAYHGTDDDNGQLITDLTLGLVVQNGP